MAQLFPRAYNTIAPAILVGVLVVLGFVGLCAYEIYWSPYLTNVKIPITQPVPFSHQHHVGGLGIDCRYCHTGVEKASFAGLPPTHTCMTCHSQLWTEAPVLAEVRQSLTTGLPIRWNRVNNVPDYVYFDHHIHVTKGVGCVSCHGRVDEMALTWKSETLYMKWCLECHRHPETKIRDRSQVVDLASPDPSAAQGEQRMKEYDVRSPQFLLDCSNCHR